MTLANEDNTNIILMLSALYMHLTPSVFNQQREIISFTRIALFTENAAKYTENPNSVFYCGKSGDFCVVTLENMTNSAIYTRSSHYDQNYSS